MCNRFDQPLCIELGPSRLLKQVWLGLYLLASGGLLYMSLDWPPRLALLGLLTAYAWFIYRLHIKLDLPYSVCSLAWDRRRGWMIRRHGSDWQPAQLRTPVLVGYRIAALRVRLGRWYHASVVVVGDRTASDDFRRLRVRLLQSAHGDRDRTKISGAR